ncbi:MAG: hypothetical protein M0C28_22950 [Candidatus Moduliflexus flocculans]|nr:hypothetical protein [Candidatus Moduliflexus flocculans]
MAAISEAAAPIPGKGRPARLVPVPRVALVRLDHVDDAMQPRAQGARVGLRNGVSAVPVAGFQKTRDRGSRSWRGTRMSPRSRAG